MMRVGTIHKNQKRKRRKKKSNLRKKILTLKEEQSQLRFMVIGIKKVISKLKLFQRVMTPKINFKSVFFNLSCLMLWMKENSL